MPHLKKNINFFYIHLYRVPFLNLKTVKRLVFFFWEKFKTNEKRTILKMSSLIFKNDLCKINSVILTGSRIPIRNTAPDSIRNIPAFNLNFYVVK
jgi:hypothetical protein